MRGDCKSTFKNVYPDKVVEYMEKICGESVRLYMIIQARNIHLYKSLSGHYIFEVTPFTTCYDIIVYEYKEDDTLFKGGRR